MCDAYKEFGDCYKPGYAAEEANPTSHPLSHEEVAAHLHGQTEQERRDYFLVEGKEKQAQDSLNRAFARPRSPIVPAHYNDTSITALMVIDDWQANFRIGNALKYLARYQKKGTPIQDLEKAAEYISLEIKRLQAA